MRKIFTLLLCAGLFATAATAQNVTLNFKNTPLKDVLKEIQNQTDYKFVYNDDQIGATNLVSINVAAQPLTTVLDDLLAKNNINYTISDKQIVLQYKPPVPANSPAPASQMQEFKVSGSILDNEGLPVPGAAIVVKGNTKKFAIADPDGRFTLSGIEPTAVLTISCIGYETMEVPVNRRGVIIFNLEPAVNLLQDVVVTGYQTISRERATGSYTIATADVLSKRPATNISSALTGLVSGMATVSSSVDGSTNRFLIRGRGTFQGQVDMDPLVVVDNMPVQGYGGQAGIDPFSTINPNDVETITVLKDAAATSIYGARAANGVIVITTKKGKNAEKLSINVDGFVSVGSKPDLDYIFNMASTENHIWYLENLRKYFYNWTHSSFNPYFNATNPFVYINDYAQYMMEFYDRGNITEAQFNQKRAELIARGDQWKEDLNKLVFQNSITQQYNLSLRGGTDKVNYSLSASFDKNIGSAIGDETNRIVVNSMNSFKLSKRLTLDFGLNTSLRKNTANGISITTLKGMISPWSRLVDEEGNFTHIANGTSTMYEPIYKAQYEGKVPASYFYNPVQDRDETDSTSERFTTRLQAGLEYKITEALKVHVHGQYERIQNKSHTYYSPNSFRVRDYVNRFSTLNAATGVYDTFFPAGGIFSDGGSFYEGYIFRAQADYLKSFGRHDITAIAGTEIMQSTSNNIPSLWRYGYNENTNSVLSSLDYVNQYRNMFGVLAYMPYTAPGGLNTTEDRFFSAYANAAYTYDSKYTITGSLRTDASNYQAIKMRDKFSPFWSVGASWIVSSENFLKDTRWVDFLKLRVSWGEAGLAAGKGNTASVTTIATGTPSLIYTNNEPLNTIASRGNPSLTWEKSRTLDLGFEFRLWRDKLYGNFTWYNKYSYDVLSSATVPIIAQGVSTATFNNAEVSNKGVEVSLGTKFKITKDLEWNGVFNFSYNKNRVLAYHVINTSTRPTTYPGYPLGALWVRNLIGYTEDGIIIQQGKDGTQEIVVNLVTAHTNDSLDGASGETPEDYNWTFYLGPNASSFPCHIGFNNSFTYKGFTLSFMLTGKFGYYFSKGGTTLDLSQSRSSFSKNLDKSIEVFNIGYDKWTGGFADIPIQNEKNADLLNNSSLLGNVYHASTLVDASSWSYAKGDHIRLNEVYLGYDLSGKKLGIDKVINNINIFVQAKNLGIIWCANKDKIDPDFPLESIKPMQTYTFGIKMNFN